MTIREILEEAFHHAVTCRSLWLFGFFIAATGNGSNGGGGRGNDAGGGLALGGLSSLVGTELMWAIGAVVLALIAVGVLMRLLSEGALIEGIRRARHGGRLSTLEGFRAGWAHWGVVLRIWLLYVGALVGSVVGLAAPALLAWWLAGPLGALLFALPALLVAVPWFVSLSLVQAFALRIAVLEERDALEAIVKARLFLHGRLLHGLKLMVADFIGSFAFVLLTVVAIVPVLLACVGLAFVLPVVPVIILGACLVVPLTTVLSGILGTFRSSVWTIGYLSEVEPA